MKLNGWRRLWIVVSAFWILFVGIFGYVERPTKLYAPHDKKFLNQLSQNAQKLLKLNSSVNLTEVKMPNGYVLRLRSDVEQKKLGEVASEYHKITVRVQNQKNKQYTIKMILLAIVPAIVLLVMGISIAWVRKGFKN